ncbi:MAG: hypothetical protein GEU77_11645, partial [Deltaproteobacteria bacterium]|nr:hypothetical protein [Deltaproteobacteria bacterium]
MRRGSKRTLPSPKFLTVGKSQQRVDGEHKVSGKAIFAADRRIEDMAWGKVLRSPYSHARITQIDLSKARRVPGVLAVLT